MATVVNIWFEAGICSKLARKSSDSLLPGVKLRFIRILKTSIVYPWPCFRKMRRLISHYLAGSSSMSVKDVISPYGYLVNSSHFGKSLTKHSYVKRSKNFFETSFGSLITSVSSSWGILDKIEALKFPGIFAKYLLINVCADMPDAYFMKSIGEYGQAR